MGIARSKTCPFISTRNFL